MTYKVVLTHTDEGYSVSCPALPGCWSEGDTKEEAISNIRSAIIEYRAVQPETPSASTTLFVEVPDEPEASTTPLQTPERPKFEVKPFDMGLPPEWTSHKIEDLLDILEGPDRKW